MHLASINVLAFLVNTREVLIKHKDLLYAVCLLRLLREFNTLSFLYYGLLILVYHK